MRIYGSETLRPKDRTCLLEPDVVDIKLYGLAGGTLPGKGGDSRGYHRNKTRKAASRRILKRKARIAGKREEDAEQE